MIRWCAYCQKFLGEVPPLENRNFSHGMCEACAIRGLSISDVEEVRMSYLVELNQRFWKAGNKGDHEEMSRLADEGISQGIRPIDILYGFAGPLLHQIGELWAKNIISYQEENRFTRTCQSLVELISKRIQKIDNPEPVAPTGTVLLSNVEGNIHTLGLHFVSLGLASLGIPSKVFVPTPTPEALVHRALSENFKVVGISISLPEQVPALEKTLAGLNSNGTFQGKIILGGFAVGHNLLDETKYPEVHFMRSANFDESERKIWTIP